MVVRHVGQVNEDGVANQPAGYAPVELVLPRCRDEVRGDECPHFLSTRQDLAELVRAYTGRNVAGAEVVDDEHGSGKHVVDDIPAAVLKRVEQVGPVPKEAVQVVDDVRLLHELLAVADEGKPAADGLGAVRLARAIRAGEDQQATAFRRAPSIEAEATCLGFKFLELRMPRGFELQVLGVPTCVWRLPRNRWGR